MREILFRGKRTDNGEWVYGNFSKPDIPGWPKTDRVFICGPIVSVYDVIPETVGQYTGINAKNGQIFEGDIIKFGKSLGAVNYDEGCFCVKPVEQYRKRSTNPAIDIVMNEYPDEIEIIGNIHDNPELLEATT